MDIAETNAGSGVQKSAVSESSHEVSVEKTAQGIKESSVSVAKRAEQSLEQKVQANVQSTIQKSLQESVQQESSRSVQQSVTSSSGSNGETVTVTEEVTIENGNEIEEVVEEDGDAQAQTIVTETITEGPNGEKVITRTTKVISAPKKIIKTVQTPGETVVTKTTTTSESKPTTKVVKKIVKKVVEAAEPEEEEVVVVTKTKTVSAPKEEVVEEVEEEPVTVTIKPKKAAEPVKEETVVEKVEVVKEEVVEEVTEEEPTTCEPCEDKPVPEAKPAAEPKPEPAAEAEPVKEEVVEEVVEEEVEEEVVEEEVVEEPAKPEPVKETPRPKDPSPKLEDVGDDEEEEEESEESEDEEEPAKPQPKTQIPTEDVSKEEPAPTQASAPPAQTDSQPDEQREIKQESIKNTLKEIISDMDRVIEQEEEKSTVVKGSENGTDYEQSSYDHITKYSTYKLTGLGGEQDKPGYSIYPSRPTFNAKDSSAHTFKPSASQYYTPKKEPSAPTTHVDLHKIFTPANDAEEILPSNRHRKKLFASSQFYSAGLHPTVEDQVELARRISHSLSDISNKQSKGQTMYSNRKKRSVKWVHEGEGRADLQSYNGYTEQIKENEFYQRQQQQHSTPHPGGRLPLKLVMDPRGQVRDLESLRRQGYNIDPPMQSPEICNDVVNALHAPKGKGAELFAKRRKKADKYIIDETTAAKHSPTGVPYVQSAGSTLPAFTEAGSQRVQQSIKYDQLIQEKYNSAQSRVKLVKSPWEAALETGYVDNAFQDIKKPTPISQPSYDYNSTPSGYYQPPPAQELPTQAPRPRPASYTSSAQRDLAYKPSVAQGWRAPPTQLPRDEHNYMPATADNIYDTLTPTNSINESHNCELQQSTQQYRTQALYTENYQNSEEAEIMRINEQSHRVSKQQSDLQIKQNYLACVSKSPELIVSDAREQYAQYDNTMRELKGALIQQTQQVKLEPLQPLQNVKLKKVVTKENYPIQEVDEEDYENQEDYKPVPVKDLINNFENQIRPIMRYKVIGDTLPPSKIPSQGNKNSAFEEYKKPMPQEPLQPNYNNVIELPPQQPVYEPPKPVQKLVNNSNKSQIKINYQNVCRATTCDKTNYEKQQELKQKYLQTHEEEYEEAHEEQQYHQSIMYDESSNSITSQKQNNENFMYSSSQNCSRPSFNHQITNNYEKSSSTSAIQSSAASLSCLENYSSLKDSLNYEQYTSSISQQQGLYTPPEIPLAGYDPPATEKFLPKPSKPSYGSSYGPSTLPPPTIVTQPPPAQQYQPQQQLSSYPNQQQQQQQQQQSYQSYQSSKTTQNFYSTQQQTKVGNVSPTPFGHQSPALQRPRPQQQGFAPKPLPQPVNQSVPWAKNVQRSLPQQQKFNNQSPVSYGSSPTPGYGSKPQQHSPQFNSYGPSPSTTLPKPQQQYNAPSNGYGTYPGRSAPSNLSPSYIQSAPVSPHINVDLSSCKNYNTAARGWNQSKDYYRPIHLDQKVKKTALPYTDF